MTEIHGRTAFVTGGGSGIGKGLALELAKQGAAVAVADIIADNARKVAEKINAAGGKAIGLACDVCERDSIAAARDEAMRKFGPVTLLFANAGVTSFDKLQDMTDADVDWLYQVCLHGATNTVRAFLPGMIEAGGGHLTATASTCGLMPGWVPQCTAYSAAKAGIIGLIMNLAMEVADAGINTTLYCPGGVASGMKANNARYRPARFGGPRNAEVDISGGSFDDKNPIPFYTPDKVAPMVLRAVRNNRPFVFDHANQRRFFRETFTNIVETCFDDIEDYEHEHGIPERNPTGPVLIETD